MKKRIFTRLAAGLLCGTLLFTDAASLDVWAVSNDPNAEQIASSEESAAAEENDAKEAENSNQEADEPEGDDTPVIESGEAAQLVEEDPDSVSEEEQPSVSENAVEETPDTNSVMSASVETFASNTSGKIEWAFDPENGKLTVTGTGDWNREDSKYAPWYDDRASIKTAEINVTGMTDASYMFFDCENLTDINLTNFDTSNVTDMSEMFYGCESLTELNAYGFFSDSVTSMRNMFAGCTALTHLDLGGRLLYSHSNLTDMSGMFQGCSELYSLELPILCSNSLVDMNSMFSGCTMLKELELKNFNTERVTNMKDMFSGCSRLERLDLSNFDVSNVTDMFDFGDCKSLTDIYTPLNLTHSVSLPSANEDKWYQSDSTEVTELPQNLNYSIALKKNEAPENIAGGTSGDVTWMIDANGKLTLSGTGDFERKDGRYVPWYNYNDSIKTAEVTVTDMTDASGMFLGCKYLTSIDLTKFDTGNVTNMKEMFSGCVWLKKLDLSNFDTSKVTDMGDMFSRCNGLTMLNLSGFNTGNVTDMNHMFYECNNLTELDLSNFNTRNVTNMNGMFYNCSKLTALNLSNFDTSKVTDMSEMFQQCHELTTLNVSNFNTDNVTDMSSMFCWCENLTTLDVNKFNTSKVIDMSWMFSNCKNLTTLDVNHFDTSNVMNMSNMFFGCTKLTTLDLSSFNTKNVTDMNSMFWECEKLSTLDLSSFDTGSVTNMNTMFYKCSKLTTIYTPRNVKQNVNLPSEPGDTWYRSNGTVVTQLPRDLVESVALGRNYTPDDKKPGIPPEDPEDPDDPDGGVLPEDIPEDGVIPKGLWISKIADQTYTGAAIEPEVRVYDGDKRLKEGADYTLKYKNHTNAAKSDDVKPPMVEVKSKGNYSGTETKTFTIAKRDISDMYVTKTFTNAYAPLANGKNPKLVFSAKYNNKALKEKTDYALTVKNNAGNEVTSYGAVGSYTAVVKGAGNYTGECSFSFEVLDKVPVSKLNIGKIATVNYDGTSKTPEPIIKYNKVTLNKGTDYTLSYLNNTAIGTATIVITGMGDYFGTRNETFSIAGLPIKQAKFIGFVKSFPYTSDKLYQSEAVLMYGAEKLVQGTDYTVSYSNFLNKGKATVTYTGIGKYTGTIKKTYSITAYSIKTDAQKRIKLSTDNISTVYAKGGARPSLKVYDGTKLLTEGSDYTLSYQNNAAVTTSTTVKQPTITVKGKGNYVGAFSEKKTFTITAKDIADVTVTAPDVAASTKIGKYKSIPVLTDTDGKKLKAGTDYDKTYTYTYKNKTEKVLNNETEVTRNAGDPVDEKDIVPANTVLCVRIKAKEGSNYTGEKTAEYRIVTSLINKAKITVQNPAQNNKNLFSYTGQDIRLDKSNLIVKVGTKVLPDDQYEILEDTYKNNVGKGTASVQIRGVGNYGGTATVKFNIGTKGFQWVQQLFE